MMLHLVKKNSLKNGAWFSREEDMEISLVVFPWMEQGLQKIVVKEDSCVL